MIEIMILKYLLKRDNFIRYYPHLEKLTLEPELTKLFGILPLLFEDNDQAEYSLEELQVMFNLEYPNVRDPEIYAGLFAQMEQADLGDAVLGKMVDKLIYKDVSNQIIQICAPVLSDSDTEDALEEVRELLDGYDKLIMPTQDTDIFVTDDLELLLDAKVRGGGIKWRLEGLNKLIGDLRGGKLGHVFARPDAGKTTFLISEMSHWASQLKQNEMGIWMNNEEDGYVLKLRWYSAITGWPEAAIEAQSARAVAYYNKLAGSKVKMIDRAGMTVGKLEAIVQRFRPKFMVIDQGDKIKSSGKFNSKTDRLGDLYAEYREWTKKYDMDILTAGQAHADAEGQMFLRQTWMNNSKTEKPGELDYAIGIGLTGKDGDLRRYIQVCKNKQGPHGKFGAVMDPFTARYTDA